MHIETVTIQKITRAEQTAIKDTRFLHLNFTLADGMPQVWTIPGWPGVHDGMTVTAILKTPLAPSTSNTVLGWRSHTDGALAHDPLRAQHVVGTVMLFAIAVLCALMTPEANGPPIGQVMAGVFLLAGVWSVWSCVARYRIAAVLRGLR